MGIIHRIAPPGRLIGEVVRVHWGTASLSRLAGLIGAWQDRARQRHHLLQLDDRLLRDIGLTRSDVAFESAKLPWQP